MRDAARIRDMSEDQIQVTIRGVRPLIMHNGQLADPTNQWTKNLKELTGKPSKDKTEQDHYLIARCEWFGGLYLDEETSTYPVIPADNIQRMIILGARKSKKGKQAEAGVDVFDEAMLGYDGPRSLDEMWSSGKFQIVKGCKVKGSRVMRCRPRFQVWAAKIVIPFAPDIIDRKDVLRALEEAGRTVGLGDWRPRYGRFEVQTK